MNFFVFFGGWGSSFGLNSVNVSGFVVVCVLDVLCLPFQCIDYCRVNCFLVNEPLSVDFLFKFLGYALRNIFTQHLSRCGRSVCKVVFRGS